MQQRQFLKLSNPVKHYAWGHPDWISDFLGRSTNQGKPQAELWMGAHPSDSSLVQLASYPGEEPVSLAELIARDPQKFLGPVLTARKVHGLPFLFKLIAAETPLSIQAHPSRAAARAGFAAESAAGIPLDDPARNYKDDNHKPEIICALTVFQALCGFRPVAEIQADFAWLASVAPDPDAVRFFGRFSVQPGPEPDNSAAYWRELCSAILDPASNKAPMIADLVSAAAGRTEDRFRLLAETAAHYPGDAGLLFFLVLQLHTLGPGQSLSFPAGVLHAYLNGLGIELMANSDNVLRGGLTPKHVDAAELLKNLDFTATGSRSDAIPDQAVFEFPPITWEFRLTRVQGLSGYSGSLDPALVPRIVLCTAGTATLTSTDGESAIIQRGESLYLLPTGQAIKLELQGELFFAGVDLADADLGLVMGIDGGGTSTRVCLMDSQAQILAIGRGGPSSIDTVPLDTTASAIKTAIAEAMANLGQEEPIVSVVAGIGGIVSPADEQRVVAVLRDLPGVVVGAPCQAHNDMKTALAGGTVLAPGIGCILGTGSVAFGRNAAGREHKAGGWGYKEGDPGSSFDLGISAIRCMVRAHDGRWPRGPFAKAVFETLGLRSIADITQVLYEKDMTRTEIAALAPLVTLWANAGDSQACAIVDRAIGEVVEMIQAVFNALFAETRTKVPVAITGSLGNASGYYRDRLVAVLASANPRLAMQSAILEPVVGAALWALQNKLGEIDPALLDLEKLSRLP